MIENRLRKPELGVQTNLSKIPGIGPRFIRDLCREFRILPKTPWKKLSGEQVKRIRARVREKNPGGIVREVRNHFNRERERGTVKGRRIRQGLTLRGQRTRTNASTAKRLNAKR